MFSLHIPPLLSATFHPSGLWDDVVNQPRRRATYSVAFNGEPIHHTCMLLGHDWKEEREYRYPNGGTETINICRRCRKIFREITEPPPRAPKPEPTPTLWRRLRRRFGL